MQERLSTALYPYLKGISGDEAVSKRLVENATQDGEIDMGLLLSGVILESAPNASTDALYNVYGDCYGLEKEAIHDACDLAALLEACGQAGKGGLGVALCLRSHDVIDEAWQTAPFRSEADRGNEISRLGAEWKIADDNKVPDTYQDWLDNVGGVFASPESIEAASKEELTEGLTSLHAFAEMSRFVKGGAVNLPAAFWSANNQDVSRVKASLSYLLFGSGDFIQRLHDLLYEPDNKLRYFGRFCALELYGTIKPAECPPMNGRMAKALRYLGYEVKAT